MIGPRTIISPGLVHRNNNTFGDWQNDITPETYIVEAWGEGFMLGALLIMSLIVIVNMRRKVLLHKLILLELIFAMSHGTFCFMAFRGYGWYLSATAALLYCSNFTHNVVAWLKIRPFFVGRHPSFGPGVCMWVRCVYLTTLAMTVPVLIFQIFNNFRFFNNISRLYERVRPYEPLMRDPWWVFSCLTLFHMIQKSYSLNIFPLMAKCLRFAILLAAIFLAIALTLMDVLACIIPSLSVTYGINPYWKIALIFKCLADNIMLDNFQSVLQQLQGLQRQGTAAMGNDIRTISQNEIDLASRPGTNSMHMLSTQDVNMPNNLN
ncbi:hypothetical protein BDW59DRAFT_168816 [Aspergillus cavernicola]|uniref:Integral membrane protein n=1 Tax=Aspergillus cavernicola TaxID=176166 RepID=A0ABR4J158_9EURO